MQRFRAGAFLPMLAFLGTTGLFAAASASGQTLPAQAATDRAQQQRAAQERSFQVDLDARPTPPPTTLPPVVTHRPIMYDTPGTKVLRRAEPPALPPLPGGVTAAPPVIGGQQLLDESQRRRQLELQQKLQAQPQVVPGFDNPTQQMQLQTQQLQFEREQGAARLDSEIMRNSERAMRRQ